MHTRPSSARATVWRKQHFHRFIVTNLNDVQVAQPIEHAFDGDLGSGVDDEVVHRFAVDFTEQRVRPRQSPRARHEAHRRFLDDLDSVQRLANRLCSGRFVLPCCCSVGLTSARGLARTFFLRAVRLHRDALRAPGVGFEAGDESTRSWSVDPMAVDVTTVWRVFHVALAPPRQHDTQNRR